MGTTRALLDEVVIKIWNMGRNFDLCVVDAFENVKLLSLISNIALCGANSEYLDGDEGV